LIQAIIVLLIVGIVWWAVEQLLPLVPLPGTIAQIIRVLLLVVLAVDIVLGVLAPLLHRIPHAFYPMKIFHQLFSFAGSGLTMVNPVRPRTCSLDLWPPEL